MRQLAFILICLVPFLNGCRDTQGAEHAHLEHDSTLVHHAEPDAHQPAIAEDAPLTIIGFYSNEESFDGQHSTGYFIHLWHNCHNLIGRLSRSNGMLGEESIVIFDTGKLSPDNSLYFEGEMEGEPFRFDGYLESSGIEGKFSWNDSEEEIYVEKCCTASPYHFNFDSKNEWLGKVGEMKAGQ